MPGLVSPLVSLSSKTKTDDNSEDANTKPESQFDSGS
jgi:hypothetical protein